MTLTVVLLCAAALLALAPLAVAISRAPAALAHRVIGKQFDATRSEGSHKLHQRVDVAANNPFTRFHALDGRQRQSGGFSQLALIDAEERARGAELPCGDHGNNIIIDVPNI